MSLLWEKSAAWRCMVRMTRDSKPFFIALATLCGVVPGVIGYGVMQATSSRNEQLEAHLHKNARPETLQILGGPYHLRPPSNVDASQAGMRWVVLIAGSSGFENYQHQVDVCHAYQTLKKGGLKDENIIVLMYDDIANNEENPKPGVIINHAQGEDVYQGVPKDYVGEDVNAGNFLAVLLGNMTALTGQGSGKVVDSGPGDHIFVFYSDHGGPGVLAMPTGPSLLANDLIDMLKEKHASGSYKSMVSFIY